MKWSSLFSRRRAANDDAVSNVAPVESKPGFRFMPYTLVIAAMLLAFSIYQQPMAQDGDATADPPAAAVIEDAPEADAQDAAPENGVETANENEAEPATPEPVATEPEAEAEAPEPAAEEPEPALTEPALTESPLTVPPLTPPVMGEPDGTTFDPAAGLDAGTIPPLTAPEAFEPPPADVRDPFDSIMGAMGAAPSVDVEAGPITTELLDENSDEDAAKEDEDKIDWAGILLSVGIFLLIVVVSGFLANTAAKAWRMPEHAFKFFLVLFTVIGSVTATCTNWKHMTLGIDLSGGVVLIYDVKAHTDADGKVTDAVVSTDDFNALLESVKKRINPAGVKEIDVRRYGTSQLKIVIPRADAAEVRRIEKLVSESGALEFRILASRSLNSDKAIIAQAESQPGVTNIYHDGVLAAKWVPINRNELSQFVVTPTPPFHPVHVVRQTGEIFEVLALKDNFNVTGEYLRNIQQGMFSSEDNPIPKPGVSFSFKSRGQTLFRELTSDPIIGALGKGSQNRRFLGIIMSGEMYSAPTLDEPITRGGCNITFEPRQGDENNKQLQQDITDLMQVMQAGALPADISKQPISRNEMGPTLGDATIRNSKLSAFIAIAGVFVFMLIYYRACGLLACFAVSLNFFLIMTVMLSIEAAFTLAGLAGLVLTLGMAVDANILIFERLREELAAGSTLRHAIRNAFSRASTAIIDSNLTTLIVAVILYTVGTEQTRGFAVTLFLGVVFTMYTAVFCLHVVFEVLERRGILTHVGMLRILNKPNINFMALRKTSVTVFAVLCVLSLGFALVRGTNMYDIDFVGGVSVDIAFKKDATVTIPEIESKLTEADIDRPTVSTVRDTVTDESQVKSAVEIGQRFTVSTATPVGNQAKKFLEFVNTAREAEQQEPYADVSKIPDDTRANYYLDFVTHTVAEQFEGQLILDTIEFTLQERPTVTGATETVADIAVYPSMNYPSLDQYLKDYSNRMVDEGKLADPLTYLITNEEDENAANSSKSYSNWRVTFYSPQADVEIVLNAFRADFNKTPWFPASNTIGSVVAGYAQVASIAAILASFVAIVLYLWLRFHKVHFGLAAVVTLINNVLITMGALAISVWLKPVFGFLLVDDFKIGLTVVAAFLTVIGYSLNDTIILFDRIREVRGKSSQLTIDHINQSVNQVLSRTLLTSVTTLYVIVVMYIFAGAGLRAFAYALGIGVVAGTFGSIFLASPLLYWMVNDPGKAKTAKGANAKSANTKSGNKSGKYDRKP